MPEKTRIIISDLHIGKNDDLDIFKSATKTDLFSGLLSYWGSRKDPVELVVNGDFVDFLQLKPWNQFGRKTALDKIQEITQASAQVFGIFGRFLQNPANSITVLLGNHDVELAYPEVRAEVEKAILAAAGGAAGGLNFLQDRTTYRFSINGVLAQVEHGNANDPWNALNYNSLFQDAETGTGTFRYPPGTHFVFDVINTFKGQFRFVDVLKPEMPAVPLILLALRPLAASLAMPKAVLEALAALGNGFLSGLRRRIAGPALGPREAPALRPSELLAQQMAEQFAAALSATKPRLAFSDADEVEDFFATSAPLEETPAHATLGPKMDRVKRHLLAAALATLERFKTDQNRSAFFAADHPENLAATWARTRLVGNVRIVVFGHTHEALKTEFAEGVYLNSGAWANLIGMPQGDPRVLSEWLARIAANQFEVACFPTYVKLAPADGGVRASLNAWSSGNEELLWEKSISPSS
jgi:UDP-2,3-diacylglucosamine pyrophosphatase LpxH